MVIDFVRSNVTHPDGYYSSARFVYRDGRAAVWITNSDRTHSRVLFDTAATVTVPETRRQPITVMTSSGDTWQVHPKSGGGCGCGGKKLLAALSIDELLADEVTV